MLVEVDGAGAQVRTPPASGSPQMSGIPPATGWARVVDGEEGATGRRGRGDALRLGGTEVAELREAGPGERLAAGHIIVGRHRAGGGVVPDDRRDRAAAPPAEGLAELTWVGQGHRAGHRLADEAGRVRAVHGVGPVALNVGQGRHDTRHLEGRLRRQLHGDLADPDIEVEVEATGSLPSLMLGVDIDPGAALVAIEQRGGAGADPGPDVRGQGGGHDHGELADPHLGHHPTLLPRLEGARPEVEHEAAGTVLVAVEQRGPGPDDHDAVAGAARKGGQPDGQGRRDQKGASGDEQTGGPGPADHGGDESDQADGADRRRQERQPHRDGSHGNEEGGAEQGEDGTDGGEGGGQAEEVGAGGGAPFDPGAVGWRGGGRRPGRRRGVRTRRISPGARRRPGADGIGPVLVAPGPQHGGAGDDEQLRQAEPATQEEPAAEEAEGGECRGNAEAEAQQPALLPGEWAGRVLDGLVPERDRQDDVGHEAPRREGRYGKEDPDQGRIHVRGRGHPAGHALELAVADRAAKLPPSRRWRRRRRRARRIRHDGLGSRGGTAGGRTG